MPESNTNTSLLDLAVRVSVLESQMTSLSAALNAHQGYVARELAHQNEVTASNHKENTGKLDVLTNTVQVVLDRNMKSDGALAERTKWATRIGNTIIAILSGTSIIALYHWLYPAPK